MGYDGYSRAEVPDSFIFFKNFWSRSSSLKKNTVLQAKTWTTGRGYREHIALVEQTLLSDPAQSIIFIVAAKTSEDKDEVCIKHMDESEGPNIAYENVPLSWLDYTTAPRSQYAEDFYTKIREAHATNNPAQKITFPSVKSLNQLSLF